MLKDDDDYHQVKKEIEIGRIEESPHNRKCNQSRLDGVCTIRKPRHACKALCIRSNSPQTKKAREHHADGKIEPPLEKSLEDI